VLYPPSQLISNNNYKVSVYYIPNLYPTLPWVLPVNLSKYHKIPSYVLPFGPIHEGEAPNMNESQQGMNPNRVQSQQGI
jgi:hypothetical protein